MTAQKHDWQSLRNEFVKGEMKLIDLSSEKCPDEARRPTLPPYSHLKLRAHEQRWKALREAYRLQQQQAKISAYLPAPVEQGALVAGSGGIIETPSGVPYELPKTLQQRYNKASADGELLALKREIALVNARLLQLADKLGSGESSETWLRLRSLMKELVEAQRTGDPNAPAYFEEMHRLIFKGAEDTALWAEITALQEHLRKLIESERRRLVELKQYVTNEEATALINSLLEAIKRNVEQKQLTRIVQDFAKLTDRGRV